MSARPGFTSIRLFPWVVQGAAAITAGYLIQKIRPDGQAIAAICALLVTALVLAYARVSPIARDQSILGFATTASLAGAMLLVTFNGVRLQPEATVGDGLLLVATFFAFIWIVYDNDVRQQYLPGWLFTAAAVTLLSILLSTIASSDAAPDVAPGLRYVATLLVVPLVLAFTGSSDARLRALAIAWVASGAVSALIATTDFLGMTSIGPAVTGISFPGRAAGLTAHPNHLALVCAMAIPVSLALTSSARKWRRVPHIATVGVLISGILVSASRAGIVAGIAAVAFVPLFSKGSVRRIALLSVLAAIPVLVFTTQVSEEADIYVGIERLLQEDLSVSNVQVSNESRLALYREAADDIFERPFTGHGYGLVRTAHNLYLQLLQAGGVLALGGFLLFAVGILRTGIVAARLPQLSPSTRQLAAGLGASMAVWLLSGLVQNPVYDRFLYVPAGLLLAAYSMCRKAGLQEPAIVDTPNQSLP